MANLPESFVRYTREIMGEKLFEQFLRGMESDVPASIRLNPLKRDCGDAKQNADCRIAPPNFTPVPWCAEGYYLSERPPFTFDPLLHTGCYYVQEASSMFVSAALKQMIDSSHPTVMLDMCAAPGGKSTAAISALPQESILVSNEPIRQRAQILTENMHKWGYANTIVTNNYPQDYAESGIIFDVILCDVPCSGEGMFRKDEGAIAEWSTQNVEKCRLLQREIVSNAWECLAPGGMLIYSTCTFNTKEDEENVAWICSEYHASLVKIETKEEWNITGSLLDGFDGPVYRFIPGKTCGEGIFMAVLRKSEDATIQRPKKKGKRKDSRQNKGNKGAKAKNAEYISWLSDSNTFGIVENGDNINAIPVCMMDLYESISRSMKVLKAGITIGQIKGKDVIPSQSLALSPALSADAFPKVNLTYQQAIAYLQKNPVALPDDTPKGYVLMTYKNVPLGFVKNIGNRANNLYPLEWKIKSTHVPDEFEVIK